MRYVSILRVSVVGARHDAIGNWRPSHSGYKLVVLAGPTQIIYKKRERHPDALPQYAQREMRGHPKVLRHLSKHIYLLPRPSWRRPVDVHLRIVGTYCEHCTPLHLQSGTKTYQCNSSATYTEMKRLRATILDSGSPSLVSCTFNCWTCSARNLQVCQIQQRSTGTMAGTVLPLFCNGSETAQHS